MARRTTPKRATATTSRLPEAPAAASDPHARTGRPLRRAARCRLVRRLVAALLRGPAAVEGALALGRVDLVLVGRVLRPLLVEDPLGGVEIAVGGLDRSVSGVGVALHLLTVPVVHRRVVGLRDCFL